MPRCGIDNRRRAGLLAVVAVLTAGAAPLWAQSGEESVVRAVIDNGCELSRDDARGALRGTGVSPRDARVIIRDLVAQGRGRVESGTFIYEDGACAPAGRSTDAAPVKAGNDDEETVAAEPSEAAPAEPVPDPEAETRMDDMVALIRANDCEMADDEAEVVLKAARLGYFEIASYMMTLVEQGQASFDGRTVVLSSELCEASK